MHRYALPVALLGLSMGVAHAANTNWNAICHARDENTIWFVLTAPPPPADDGKDAAKKDDKSGKKDAKKDDKAKPPAEPNPDFSCGDLYFDSVPCPQTVVLGKIKQVGEYSTKPIFELSYMPSGESAYILNFLDKVGPSVIFKPDIVQPVQIGAPEQQMTREELFAAWLTKRRQASQATQGITVHLWLCPDGDFSPPDQEITPYGMSVVSHTATAPF